MAQTMKEIIKESFGDITEVRLCELLPHVVRGAKGEEFLKTDAELSSMIRRCLDESADGGMIGMLLPESKVLKPFAVVNRGGILITESLDNASGFRLGMGGKKALAKILAGIIPEAQTLYDEALKNSEADRQREKEEAKKAKEAKKREMEAKREQEEREKYLAKLIKDGDDAYRSLRTGRVFRPEMPDMLKLVLKSELAANGALENKSISEFESEFETDMMELVFSRTAEILDNEIAKRSQMALDALESKEALWDFITGYQEYLSSKKLDFRDKLINHGEIAFDTLFEMDASDDVQLWKIPELLKQIYLGYLASDEDLTENDIDDCKADPAFDKAVELVSNITTMNIRLGTLNPDAGSCRSEIIRQIEAARRQISGN